MTMDAPIPFDHAPGVQDGPGLEAKFRRIFDGFSLPLAFTETREGRILDVNEAWLKTSGLTLEACLGRNGAELGLWAVPEDREAIAARIAAEGCVKRFETRLTLGGRTFPATVSAHPVALDAGPHLLWEFEDLTERHQVARDVRQREADLRALFELNSDGVVLLRDGRVLDANPAAAAQLRCSRERLLGTTPWDWSPDFQPDGQASAIKGMAMVATVQRDGVARFEWVHRRMDGECYLAEITLIPIQFGGGPVIYGTMRDITERKKAEEQRLHLQAQLLHAQKMDSLGSLAGGVAHDMNNVLGAILALTSANLTPPWEEGVARASFETIHQAALRGGAMVRSMLAFARKTPATDGNVDLNGLTGEVVRLLERTTLARVRLTLDLDGELRPIRGDADALAQALMNLCINAVDAMEGAGALNLATLNLDGGWVELRVEDSGCGMPPEVLERALTPYYTTKEEGRGTGLGLALVYSTVKAHGGELALESAPGAGTRVRLRFPGVAAPSAGSAPAAAPPAAIRPLRVLLVDDDELVLRATAMLLGTLGHTATTAATGEEALECLARGLDPEVVILDMNMPGLGGHGTLPRLRALRPDLPVLLATGRADQKAVDLVAAHARVSLLPKPYALEDLNRCLGDLA